MIQGPILGGRFVKTFNFPWLMRTVGIINISYCCLLVFLSKVSNDKTDKVRKFSIANIEIKAATNHSFFFFFNLQINRDTSKVTDYKSTNIVSFFNKPITYKKLDEIGEHN